MNPFLLQGQVININDGAHSGGPAADRRSGDHGKHQTLKDRVAETVRAARTAKEMEKQKALERAQAERQEVQQLAKAALLLLLSDDVIHAVIGRHALIDNHHVGTMKVSKAGVELFTGTGVGAAHTVGDILDIKFEGAVVQIGPQLNSDEFLCRIKELLSCGIKVSSIYNPSVQALFITFDYEKTLG